MKSRLWLAAALVPLVTLAACGGSDETESGEGADATGEVFAPTVSDAMIPTDQLRSAPPLLRTQPAPVAGGDEEEVGAMEQAFGDDETDAAPEPAPAPAPQDASPPPAAPAGE